MDNYHFTYGSTWGDFNNDGFLDLFVGVIKGPVFGESKPFNENLLFMNQGDGSFERVTTGNVITDGAQALAANDIDNDGDLDLVITHGNLAPPFLTYIYKNDGNENHWLNLTCEGTTSNRSAIGTRIRVKAKIGGNDVWMTRELTQENGVHACNGPRLHFGLGNVVSADSLIIRWPSGHTDTILNVPANQFYSAIEGAALEIDFKATNYIQLARPFNTVFLDSENDSIQLDLSEYLSLVTGDTVPEFEGDTLTYTIRSNENPEVVSVSLDPDTNILSLEAGTEEGTSVIQIITSAGFTRRMDQFSVTYTISDLTDSRQADPSVLIYPNPVTDLLFIDVSESVITEFEVVITDLQGSVVFNHSGNIHELDLSSLQKGMYFISIKSQESVTTKKIIKL